MDTSTPDFIGRLKARLHANYKRRKQSNEHFSNRRKTLVDAVFHKFDRELRGSIQLSVLLNLHPSINSKAVSNAALSEVLQDFSLTSVNGKFTFMDFPITYSQFVDYYQTMSLYTEHESRFEKDITTVWRISPEDLINYISAVQRKKEVATSKANEELLNKQKSRFNLEGIVVGSPVSIRKTQDSNPFNDTPASTELQVMPDFFSFDGNSPVDFWPSTTSWSSYDERSIQMQGSSIEYPNTMYSQYMDQETPQPAPRKMAGHSLTVKYSRLQNQRKDNSEKVTVITPARQTQPASRNTGLIWQTDTSQRTHPRNEASPSMISNQSTSGPSNRSEELTVGNFRCHDRSRPLITLPLHAGVQPSNQSTAQPAQLQAALQPNVPPTAAAAAVAVSTSSIPHPTAATRAAAAAATASAVATKSLTGQRDILSIASPNAEDSHALEVNEELALIYEDVGGSSTDSCGNALPWPPQGEDILEPTQQHVHNPERFDQDAVVATTEMSAASQRVAVPVAIHMPRELQGDSLDSNRCSQFLDVAIAISPISHATSRLLPAACCQLSAPLYD